MRLRFVIPLFLIGCSGSSASPLDGDPGQVDAGREAGDDASTPDASTPVVDAGPDADASTTDACTPPAVTTDPVTSFCDVVAATCSTCAGGVMYRCTGEGQRGQPRSRATGGAIGNCRLVAEVGGAADYCCPDACVYNRDTTTSNPDLLCSAGRPARVRCIANPDGTPKAGLPNDCSYTTPTPGELGVSLCCSM